MIDELLVFYGNGEDRFGNFVRSVSADLRAGTTTDLCELMSKHGSDKGLGYHNYTAFYKPLFQQFVPSVKTLFELGIGTNDVTMASNMGADGVPGASLRAWHKFFPYAEIFGADIDHRILFESDRIRTFLLDQTKPEMIRALWAMIPHRKFDIIIDDGLHTFEANSCFLMESLHSLNPEGLFIIEDILMNIENVANFDRLFSELKLNGFLFRLPYRGNKIDNAIAVVCSHEAKNNT